MDSSMDPPPVLTSDVAHLHEVKPQPIEMSIDPQQPESESPPAAETPSLPPPLVEPSSPAPVELQPVQPQPPSNQNTDSDIATLLLALARPQTPPLKTPTAVSNAPPSVETPSVPPASPPPSQPSSASLASLLAPEPTQRPFPLAPTLSRTIYSDAAHLPLSSEASSSTSRPFLPPPHPAPSSSVFSFPPPSTTQDGDGGDQVNDESSLKALAKTGSKRKRTNSSRGPPNRLSGEFSGKGKAKATASPVDIDHSFPPSVSHILDPDSGLIRCICSNTDDDGFTIQCDQCYAWEHAVCMGIEEGSVPDDYLCELCLPREVDIPGARQKQRRRRVLEDQKARGEEPQPSRSHAKGGGTKVNGLAASPNEDPSGPLRESVPTPNGGGSKHRRKPTPSSLGTPTPGPSKSRKPNLLREALLPPQPSPFPSSNSSATPQRPSVDTSSQPVYPSTPLASSSTGLVQTPAPNPETDEDEPKLEAWTLEYTPVRDIVIRDPAIRESLTSVLEEWVGRGEALVEPKVVEGEDVEMDDASLKVNDELKDLPSAQPSPLPSQPQGDFRTSEPPNPKPFKTSAVFSALDPLLPPVYLSGPSLSSLVVKTAIRPLQDSATLLPQSFAVSHPSMAAANTRPVYPRPTFYALFADSSIPSGSFIGEYKGEVLDAGAYRRNPINQYRLLGVPKPTVRSLGPPFDLVIDARGFGNDLRFVRSGCHPNVVLRPAIFSRTPPEEGDLPSWSSSLPNSPAMPELIFGLFASRDITRREEITLPWEWDDSHVVHALLPLLDIKPSPAVPSPLDLAIEALAPKFSAVLSHLTGTFASCSCEKKKDCAVFQMGRLVEGKGFLGLVEKTVGGGRGGRRPKKPDFGLLVGAVRGWRRKEEERAERIELRRRALEQKQVEERLAREAELLSEELTSEDENVFGLNLGARSGGEMDVDIPSHPEPMLVSGEDPGNFSDASTLTEPLSHFSDDSDSENEVAPGRSRRPTVSTASSSASPPPPLPSKHLSSPIRSPIPKSRPKVANRRRVSNRVESVSPPPSPTLPSASVDASSSHPPPPVVSSSKTDIFLDTVVESSTFLGASTSSPFAAEPLLLPFDPWTAELDPVPPPLLLASVHDPFLVVSRPVTPPSAPKEPTPPPKEPTPPPKEPSPPPVPVKRMSLKDWSKRRKETAPEPTTTNITEEGEASTSQTAGGEEVKKEGWDVVMSSNEEVVERSVQSPSASVESEFAFRFDRPLEEPSYPSTSLKTESKVVPDLDSSASRFQLFSSAGGSTFQRDRSPPRFAPIPRPAPPAPFVAFPRRSASPEAAVPFRFLFNDPTPPPRAPAPSVVTAAPKPSALVPAAPSPAPPLVLLERTQSPPPRKAFTNSFVADNSTPSNPRAFVKPERIPEDYVRAAPSVALRQRSLGPASPAALSDSFAPPLHPSLPSPHSSNAFPTQSLLPLPAGLPPRPPRALSPGGSRPKAAPTMLERDEPPHHLDRDRERERERERDASFSSSSRDRELSGFSRITTVGSVLVPPSAPPAAPSSHHLKDLTSSNSNSSTISLPSSPATITAPSARGGYGPGPRTSFPPGRGGRGGGLPSLPAGPRTGGWAPPRGPRGFGGGGPGSGAGRGAFAPRGPRLMQEEREIPIEAQRPNGRESSLEAENRASGANGVNATAIGNGGNGNGNGNGGGSMNGNGGGGMNGMPRGGGGGFRGRWGGGRGRGR